MKENNAFKERVRFPIPDRELERRWSLVRSKMREQDIDLLIMQNDNQFLGGYVRYFTDIPAEHAYPVSVLFPLEDDMVTITSSSPDHPLYPEWALRGKVTRFGTPYFRSLDFSKNYDGKVMVNVIKERNIKKVGFVNLGLINTALSGYLKENLPDVSFVDATDLVDRIKAVKSEDELVFVQKSVELHDAICAAIPAILRPGIHEFEVRNMIRYLMENQGSEHQLIKIGSSPYGEPTPFLDSFFQNRKLSQGDNIQILVEGTGPGGFYTEIQRVWCLGEPHQDLVDAWEISKKVQIHTASLLKPGAVLSEVNEKANDYLVSLGQPRELRSLGHSQGYDMVERPGISPDEYINVEENMYFSLHSEIVKGTGAGAFTDDYLITKDGAVHMHKTPQEVFIL